jgi:hypothetical protein
LICQRSKSQRSKPFSHSAVKVAQAVQAEVSVVKAAVSDKVAAKEVK